MMTSDKGKHRATEHDNDDVDQDRDQEPSSPRSFAHLAALSARLYDFCKQGSQPTEHDLAYLQATVCCSFCYMLFVMSVLMVAHLCTFFRRYMPPARHLPIRFLPPRAPSRSTHRCTSHIVQNCSRVLSIIRSYTLRTVPVLAVQGSHTQAARSVVSMC